MILRTQQNWFVIFMIFIGFIMDLQTSAILNKIVSSAEKEKQPTVRVRPSQPWQTSPRWTGAQRPRRSDRPTCGQAVQQDARHQAQDRWLGRPSGAATMQAAQRTRGQPTHGSRPAQRAAQAA